MNRSFDLENRQLACAAGIVRFTEGIVDSRAGEHVAGQLLRSGTAPLPNHGEVQAAESATDFVRRARACLKALRQSRRWLLRVQQVPLIDVPVSVDSLLREGDELIRMCFTSVRTARKRAFSVRA